MCNMPKHLRESAISIGSLLMLAILFLCGASGCVANESIKPENIVSFFGTVSPNSKDKTFGAVVIGAEQATSEDLNKLLRPNGNKVLIVTSVTGYHITPTNKAPFSVVAILGLRENGSTRGWGNGGLSVSGLQTTQVDYRPGIVVTLMSDESLCIASFIQSNDKARVGVHGYLIDKP